MTRSYVGAPRSQSQAHGAASRRWRDPAALTGRSGRPARYVAEHAHHHRHSDAPALSGHTPFRCPTRAYLLRSPQTATCLLARDPAPMSSAIRCRQLVKRYEGKPPVEAVRGLDLEIRTGECFGLLGPNGAGKTTTMEILEGLLDATSADLMEILDYKWGRDDDAIRQRIGISLQETRLSDKLTVTETVTLFRSFYHQGLDPAEAIRRVSLEEKAGAHIEKLSGGQRQRLAVACG